MARLDEDELEYLESYARKLRNQIDEFKKYANIIKFPEEQQIVNEAAIEILERKYEAMTKAKNRKELNKIIQVKRIIREADENIGKK